MAARRRIGNRLRKLRQLSASERRLLAQAAIWLPATGSALRILGFQRVHAFLTRMSLSVASETPPSDSAIGEARAAARIVKVAAGHGLYRATCLPESLVVWWLLRRRGLPADLRIGTRREKGRIEAHAWVEIQGTVINDAGDVRTRFASFERSILPMRIESPPGGVSGSEGPASAEPRQHAR